MKKYYLNSLSKIGFFGLFIFSLLTLHSCKKDRDYYNKDQFEPNAKQSIKHEDISAYISANRAMQLLSLNWQKAQQTTIGDKKVVRVPTLNIDKTSLIFNNGGSLNLKKLGSTPPSSSTATGTPASGGNNTNYDEQHPPEVFFIQQNGKTNLDAFLLNFVPTDKTKENGENGIWTGKLVEWNLAGDTILVQEINRNELSNIYAVSKNVVNNDGRAKQTQLSVSNKQSGFWRDLWDALGEFVGWIGSLFGLSERHYDPYDFSWEWRLAPNFDWLTGGGGGGDSGGGGGGYTGAGYPIYDDYLPGYRPSDIFPYEYPGNDPYAPYSGGPNVLMPTYSASLIYLMGNIMLTPEQIDFLATRNDIAQGIENYLLVNGISTLNKEFAEWAAGYLLEDETLFNQAFKDLLNGVYNENSPIYLPSGFNVEEDQAWNEIEDEAGIIASEIFQQGLPNSDPIPESYYKNGTPIDMSNAPVKSRTVKGAPRNATYFWKELIKKRPEMFSAENREYISKNELKKIKVDDQWIKYNPTHKAYNKNQIVHHHHEQGKMAYAIPAKVHQKWTRILHTFRTTGKITRIRGSLNSLASALQMFSLLTDLNTGNPDAWVNWFGGANEVGKIYKQPFTGDYFEITKQILIRNDQGKVVFAIVTYDVYADYIWDEDEKRYMGVLKLGTFTEDIDMLNKRSTQSKFEMPSSWI